MADEREEVLVQGNVLVTHSISFLAERNNEVINCNFLFIDNDQFVSMAVARADTTTDAVAVAVSLRRTTCQ